jgi:hypothetical protein
VLQRQFHGLVILGAPLPEPREQVPGPSAGQTEVVVTGRPSLVSRPAARCAAPAGFDTPSTPVSSSAFTASPGVTWLDALGETLPCRSFLLGQPDLTFPDHTVQPVKLAPDSVLRFPVSRTMTNGPRGMCRSRPSEGATTVCPTLKRW